MGVQQLILMASWKGESPCSSPMLKFSYLQKSNIAQCDNRPRYWAKMLSSWWRNPLLHSNFYVSLPTDMARKWFDLSPITDYQLMLDSMTFFPSFQQIGCNCFPLFGRSFFFSTNRGSVNEAEFTGGWVAVCVFLPPPDYPAFNLPPSPGLPCPD